MVLIYLKHYKKRFGVLFLVCMHPHQVSSPGCCIAGILQVNDEIHLASFTVSCHVLVIPCRIILVRPSHAFSDTLYTHVLHLSFNDVTHVHLIILISTMSRASLCSDRKAHVHYRRHAKTLRLRKGAISMNFQHPHLILEISVKPTSLSPSRTSPRLQNRSTPHPLALLFSFLSDDKLLNDCFICLARTLLLFWITIFLQAFRQQYFHCYLRMYICTQQLISTRSSCSSFTTRFWCPVHFLLANQLSVESQVLFKYIQSVTSANLTA